MLAGPSLPARAVSCSGKAALIEKSNITKNPHAEGPTQHYRGVTVESAILAAIHKKLKDDCLIEISHRCCDKYSCPHFACICQDQNCVGLLWIRCTGLQHNRTSHTHSQRTCAKGVGTCCMPGQAHHRLALSQAGRTPAASTLCPQPALPTAPALCSESGHLQRRATLSHQLVFAFPSLLLRTLGAGLWQCEVSMSPTMCQCDGMSAGKPECHCKQGHVQAGNLQSECWASVTMLSRVL